MRIVGIIATGIVAVAAWSASLSAPARSTTCKRYLRMRSM